jgi:hypothetical protein
MQTRYVSYYLLNGVVFYKNAFRSAALIDVVGEGILSTLEPRLKNSESRYYRCRRHGLQRFRELAADYAVKDNAEDSKATTMNY